MGNKRRINTMARIASDVFFVEGWEWGSGDGRHIPDAEELARTIRELKKRADAEGLKTIESCRILVVRDDEFGEPFYEVYLNLGELN